MKFLTFLVIFYFCAYVNQPKLGALAPNLVSRAKQAFDRRR